MVFITFISIVSALVIGFITYFKWSFSFWKKRNLYYLEPSIPFGTSGNIFNRKESPGEAHQRLYTAIRAGGHKHGGAYIFSKPQYIPVDLEYIKCVLSKDFHYFHERGFYYNEKDQPLSGNLFAIGGEKWRTLRSKLTQTFTSGKIKTMFDIILRCSDQMLEAVRKEKAVSVNVQDLTARYTTDVIGNCAFGLDCNSFESPDAEFRKNGKKLFEPFGYIHNIGIVIAITNHDLGRKLGVNFIPEDVHTFFMKVIKDTVAHREKHNVERNDMLKLMMDLRRDTKNHLTIEEIAAQALIFFLAGFETSSTTMSYCLYELSKHPVIQDRVREEIGTVISKYEGRITYEAIKEMKYLDRVVHETLRKYPPLPFITRKCVEDYRVPGTDVVVPKGVTAYVSILGIHHDPEYYPNPEKFDPDRFLPEVAEKRPNYTYIPFGEGPRICIGLRFGLLQTKIGLLKLLQDYVFTTNSQTPKKMVFQRYNLLLTPETDIQLNLHRL